MSGRQSRVAVPLAVLLVALPALFLTHEGFQPVTERLPFEGPVATATVVLPAAQPLILESELTVRGTGAGRPFVIVSVNGAPAGELRAQAWHRLERGELFVPATLVRPGPNSLTVAIGAGAGADATFALTARLRNYAGIAPDFPRMVLVPDAAVATLADERGVAVALARGAVFVLGAWVLVWALHRLARGAVPRWVPAVLLLPVAFYSLASPLHVWLSVEALLLFMLVPWLLAIAGRALWWHRRATLTVLQVTVVTLVLLEVALRVMNHLSPSFIFYADGFGRYRGQPGAPHFDARLNSGGFNDEERSQVRPPGIAHRVVAIGDSFAFGVVPRADNYLTLTERALSGTRSTEVINLGVAGTDPSDYLSVLVDEGLRYAPDLVLVGFYIGNDFEARARRPHEYSTVATLARFLWNLRRATAIVPVSGEVAGRYDDHQPSMSEDVFRQIQADRGWIYAGDAPRLAAAADRAAADLARMRDLAARTGAGFLVTLLPDETQVDPAARAEVALAWGLAPDAVDVGRPTRAIAEALAAQGVEVLDLQPAFAEAGQHTRLYKPRDTHWNLAGNRLAATVIAPAVRERLPHTEK